MRVLDLDMDYFMTEIASTPFYCEERLDEEYYGNSVVKKENVLFPSHDDICRKRHY